MSIIALHCLCSGDRKEQAFTVEIATDDDVSGLIWLIRHENPDRFRYISVTATRLFKVALPIAHAEQARDPAKIDGAEKLSPLDEICDVFQQPQQGLIHVVVSGSPYVVFLNCIISGDTFEKMFAVGIAPNDNVATLKSLIRKEIPDRFTNIGVTAIRLFKVARPIDDSLSAFDPEKPGEELWPASKISDHFLDNPRGYIHVVVLTPAGSAPHPAEHAHILPLLKSFTKAVTVGRSATPSTSSTPENYQRFQAGDAPILDGRYGAPDAPNDLGLPVEIYHSAFARFLALAGDTTAELPQDVLGVTVELMQAASQIVPLDEDRQDTTRGILSTLLKATIGELVDGGTTRTSDDHAMVHYTRVSEPLGNAAIVIVQETAELGTGGEPSVQGSFAYLQHWTDDEQKELLKASCCPSFIVAIAGSWLVVLGAVFTSCAVVQRLTDYIYLGRTRAIDDTNTRRIARIFHALRSGLVELKSFYETLAPRSRNAPISVDRFFPCATSYVAEDKSIVSFRYRRYLKEQSPTCVAFLAEGPARRQLVVKFVERYGAEAHRLLADSGQAPALLYYGDVWHDGPAEGCRPRKMVVMEYVDGKVGEGRVSDEVREAVRAAVARLHSRNLVHGDIRRPNIVVAHGEGTERSRTKLLDFDWAGTQGVARYPLYLSAWLWPEGVCDDGVILPAHDLDMIKWL
ncbi:hypothetical protein FA15DRAFT_646854 [Coprinopsis marcescibilis]|uniref:Crinkler effector protein N-terminal domain-containing protein n=1 Tax=Coprinopsis marcescibilis TaxID=230819 RepID=A0A5C3KX98_COPMA|nr:hypothetical protein FA15DRAFT_646854 [Coprinopsis marcescibilis]